MESQIKESQNGVKKYYFKRIWERVKEVWSRLEMIKERKFDQSLIFFTKSNYFRELGPTFKFLFTYNLQSFVIKERSLTNVIKFQSFGLERLEMIKERLPSREND